MNEDTFVDRALDKCLDGLEFALGFVLDNTVARMIIYLVISIIGITPWVLILTGVAQN